MVFRFCYLLLTLFAQVTRYERVSHHRVAGKMIPVVFLS